MLHQENLAPSNLNQCDAGETSVRSCLLFSEIFCVAPPPTHCRERSFHSVKHVLHRDHSHNPRGPPPVKLDLSFVTLTEGVPLRLLRALPYVTAHIYTLTFLSFELHWVNHNHAICRKQEVIKSQHTPDCFKGLSLSSYWA